MSFMRVLEMVPGQKIRFSGFGETGVFTIKEIVGNVVYFMELTNKALLVKPGFAEWIEIDGVSDFDVADKDEIIDLLLGVVSYG